MLTRSRIKEMSSFLERGRKASGKIGSLQPSFLLNTTLGWVSAEINGTYRFADATRAPLPCLDFQDLSKRRLAGHSEVSLGVWPVNYRQINS